MDQIQERRRTDGKPSITAPVRRKKGGKTVFSITETFDKKSQAEAWIERKERELSQPGGLEAALTAKRSKALRNVITAYIEAQNGSIGRSKLQNLRQRRASISPHATRIPSPPMTSFGSR